MTGGLFLNSLDQIPLNARVCLYGSGETGCIFLELIKKERPDVEVSCWIDSFKSGVKEGLTVFSLREFCESSIEFDFVVITSVFWNQIERALKENSIPNYFILSSAFIFQTSHLSALSDFFFAPKDQIKIQLARDEVRQFFADTADQNLFDALVDLRIRDRAECSQRNLGKLSCQGQQYIDYILPVAEMEIIEGGMFDGCTTKQLLDVFGPSTRIVGFEPFFELLEKSPYFADLQREARLAMLPMALWSKRTKLSFRSGGLSESNSCLLGAAEEGGCTKNFQIDAVTIDEIVEDRCIKKVDYIKLDIEGSELEALRGAQQTIRNFKPQIAVSIYHRSMDLFDIPKYIRALVPEYSFRIGQYTPTFVDSVLYCIPRMIA